MTKSRRTFLLTGLAVIAITNLIAFVGIAYNRIGEPDSTLNLSERELRIPYSWRENNSVSMELKWRVPPNKISTLTDREYAWDFSVPKWLTKQKLMSLGFDEPMLNSMVGELMNGSYGIAQSKQVFIVLELNGPAYREMQEQIFKQGVNQDQAKREEERSRLIAIDAGLDFDALRANYPDRKQYAILRGNVKPTTVYSKQQDVMGMISSIPVSQVNIPVDMRGSYISSESLGDLHKFQASIAFGKRLEPWLLAFTPSNN